jgi:hypothetical protein
MIKRLAAVILVLAMAGSAQAAFTGVLIDSRATTRSSARTTWVCVYDAAGRRVTVVQDYPCEGTKQVE